MSIQTDSFGDDFKPDNRVVSAAPVSPREEAIERALANPPDIILMDVQMPRLDGLQAIKRLREDERTAKVPIVCLTALGMVDDRERCLQAGADYYICKPINFPELTQTINQLLASRKAQPA